ncbi:hypothetical protein C0J52_01071 [Blattella germanica]|nr:hypothetical protein C0J52_01071 [Blattella germanica]
MLEGGVNETTITSLPIFLLVILVVLVFMGLKLRWFRARMNMGISTRNSEVTPLSGSYRTLARDEFRTTTQSFGYHNERTAVSSQQTSVSTYNNSQATGLQTNGKSRSVDNLVSETRSEIKMNGHAKPPLSGGINPLINRPLSSAASHTHSSSSNSLINQSVHSKSANHIDQVASTITVPKQAAQSKTKRPAPKGILHKGKAPPPPPLPSKNSSEGSAKFTLEEDDYEEFET